MSWRLETTHQFDRQFKKLDRYTQLMIKNWIVKNLDATDDPRLRGKALVGNRRGLWRYRIGDYRLICTFEVERLVILALSVGRRKEIDK